MIHMYKYVKYPGLEKEIMIIFGKPLFLSMLCKVG